MALIENTVGELPYKLTDFDQHSYEAEDCFTRFMPKAKLDTAVRPIIAPSGRKILLANDRIVTALENDLDQAYVPGSLVEMLKQRSSGDAAAADRFYEPMQTGIFGQGRPAQATHRAADRTGDHVSRRLGTDGRRVPQGHRSALRQHRVVQQVDQRGLGIRLSGPDLRAGDAVLARPRPRVRGTRPRPGRRRPVHRAACGAGVRPLTRRPVLRPDLVAHQRSARGGVLPHR